ncbi:MAG: carbonic anhydrase [Desulfuromonadaceae bacterium]|nr:carbonic anhydrase [Desulfuromonadaceae bacterium]
MKDLDELVMGFRRFQENYFTDDTGLFEQLRQGQNPKTLAICCSDSRVDPSLLTDSAPGDLFVIRNVAGLVPPYQPDCHYHGVSAALEYAVKVLEVEHILLIGHSQCGGINGLMNLRAGQDDNEFINRWVEIAKPAKQAVLKTLAGKPQPIQERACEQASLLLSLENLLTFPWVVKKVEARTLALHAWYVDIQSGELQHYVAKRGQFETLVKHPEKKDNES